LYYVLDQPEIHRRRIPTPSCASFATWKRGTPSWRRPDSPTGRVGGKPREGFVKVQHSSPMLSLDNALNEGELRDFDRRVRELAGRPPNTATRSS